MFCSITTCALTREVPILGANPASPCSTNGDIRLNRPDSASWDSIRDALNVWRSGSDQFQLRWLFESTKKRPCNFVVNFCRMLKLKRITDHDLESALSEVKAAIWFRKIDSEAVGILHQPVLLNDFVAILRVHTFDRRQHAFLREVVVVVWGEDQFDFVPAEISPWDLFEEARRGLKHNGIRENDHSARRLRVRCRSTQFHEMKPNQSDIHDVSSHSRDLDPITDSDAIFADQEKIAGDRQNDVLQSDRNSRRDQTSECCK